MDDLREMGPDSAAVQYLLNFSCVATENRAVVGPLYIRPISDKSTLGKSDSIDVEMVDGLPVIEKGTILNDLRQQLALLLTNARKLVLLKTGGQRRASRCTRIDIALSTTPGYENNAIIALVMSNVCLLVFEDDKRPIVNVTGCSSVAFGHLGSCVFEFETQPHEA